VSPLVNLGADVDTLAAQAADFFPCSRVRDAKYLRWRWPKGPGTREMRQVRDSSGQLLGLSVLQIVETERHASGHVVDLLTAEPQALRALLLDATTYFRNAGCDAVFCDCLDPRPWSRWVFRRSGFIQHGADVNVVCRSLTDRANPAVVERLESWFLTLGDTDGVQHLAGHAMSRALT
jgi:hypothetical protein